MLRPARFVVALLLGLFLAGCDGLQPQQPSARTATPKAPSLSIPAQPAAASPGDTIEICSFNLQVFGTSKLKKPQAMDVLTKVVRRFDVVAIQEVRSTDDISSPAGRRMPAPIRAWPGRHLPKRPS